MYFGDSPFGAVRLTNQFDLSAFKSDISDSSSTSHLQTPSLVYSLEEQCRCCTEPRAAYPPIRLAPPCIFILERQAYTLDEAPDDAPTLDSREYDRWFLLTLLGKPHYDDRKASEERKILWRLVHHDPYTEPDADDWEDFLRNKRDDRTQNHRASRDEPKNTIYENMASVDPLGLTMMMPNQSYPPPQSHHQRQVHPSASPTSQPLTLVLPAEYSRSFDPQMMGLL